MEDEPQQCRVKSVKFEAVGQDRSRLREKKGLLVEFNDQSLQTIPYTKRFLLV